MRMRACWLLSTTLAALLVLDATGAETKSMAEEQLVPICGMVVGHRRKAEVLREGTADKFRHCALSCVITLGCGPLDAYNVGLMKEIYDALGFGTPSLEDLRADVAGIDLGISRDIRTRSDCYRGCGKIYPRQDPTEN